MNLRDILLGGMSLDQRIDAGTRKIAGISENARGHRIRTVNHGGQVATILYESVDPLEKSVTLEGEPG